MGEEGKGVPKQQAGNKRPSEGLVEIPADLFSKRPRYEVTSPAIIVPEVYRQNERRQKNKEAAERSRLKKKEEFATLQTENDQLQQDKCQLVSMVERLKTDLQKVSVENTALRSNFDHLKRWIGKHANDLGLGKHLHKPQAEEVSLVRTTGKGSGGDSVLRGDPSLHSAGPAAADEDRQLTGSASPPLSYVPTLSASSFAAGLASPLTTTRLQVSPAPPKVLQAVSKCSSPPLPTQEMFQPVGIRTVASLPHQSLSPSRKQAQEVTISLSSETGQQQEAVFAGGQQLVYVPNETVFIVQGEDGKQMIVVAQGEQHAMFGAAQETQQVTAAVPVVQPINAKVQEQQGAWLGDSEVQEIRVESTDVQETNTEAIEVQETTVEALEAQEASMGTAEVQEASMRTVEAQEASTQTTEAQKACTQTAEAEKATAETGEPKEAAQAQKAIPDTAEEQSTSTEAPEFHKVMVEVQEAQEEVVEAQEEVVEAQAQQEEVAEVPQAPSATKEGLQKPAAADDNDNTPTARHGDVSENNEPAKPTTDTTKDTDSEILGMGRMHRSAILADSIQLLIKMGYKIQPPQ